MARSKPSSRPPSPEVIERERRVIELRRAGCAWDEIAQQVGYSDRSTAHDVYQRAMNRVLVKAGTEELRSLEGERLDRLQRAVWAKAIGGDLPAVHTVLRVMERRAKLFGLDAPIQVGVTVEHLDPATIDSEVARLAAMLKSSDPKALPEIVIEDGGGVD